MDIATSSSSNEGNFVVSISGTTPGNPTTFYTNSFYVTIFEEPASRHPADIIYASCLSNYGLTPFPIGDYTYDIS